MVKDNFNKVFKKISKYYDKRLIKYRNSPRSVGQININTLEKRLSILFEVGNLKNSKILDFGCGTGYLYSYLKKKIKFSGEYVGYDISNEMINFAKKNIKKHDLKTKIFLKIKSMKDLTMY